MSSPSAEPAIRKQLSGDGLQLLQQALVSDEERKDPFEVARDLAFDEHDALRARSPDGPPPGHLLGGRRLSAARWGGGDDGRVVDTRTGRMPRRQSSLQATAVLQELQKRLGVPSKSPRIEEERDDDDDDDDDDETEATDAEEEEQEEEAKEQLLAAAAEPKLQRSRSQIELELEEAVAADLEAITGKKSGTGGSGGGGGGGTGGLLDGSTDASDDFDDGGFDDDDDETTFACAIIPPPVGLSRGGGDSGFDAFTARRVGQVRYELMKALVDDERQYVASLCTRREVFVEPLREQSRGGGKKLMSAVEVGAVFNNIGELYNIHVQLLAALEDRLARWWSAAVAADGGFTSRATAGDILGEFAPFLLAYAAYANSFAESSATVTRLRKDRRAFDRFCAAGEADPGCDGRSLMSLMILPVGRVPRYRGKLRQLLQATPEGHPDRRLLLGAMASVRGTCEKLGATFKRYQNQLKVLSVEERLDASRSSKAPLPLAAPHREFVMEGPLRKLDRRGDATAYWFFLFNDLLIYGKAKQQVLREAVVAGGAEIIRTRTKTVVSYRNHVYPVRVVDIAAEVIEVQQAEAAAAGGGAGAGAAAAGPSEMEAR